MATAQEDYYRAARALMRGSRSGTLATVQEGQPFAALVTPAFLPDLTPLLLLSGLSAHTRHLRKHAACALLLSGPPAAENPQTAPRLCLTASAAPAGTAENRAAYLAVHPYAAGYIDFGDFSIWALSLVGAHYVGGFAAAADLEIAELCCAAP